MPLPAESESRTVLDWLRRLKSRAVPRPAADRETATSDAAVVALFEQAVRAHEQGRLAEAESKYRDVVTRAPDHIDALHFLGLVASQLGRHGEAEQLIHSALSLNAGNAPAHVSLGKIRAARGDSAGAMACFREALRIVPTHTDALVNLGRTLIARGEPGEAITQLRSALTRMPGEAQLHQALGNALLGSAHPGAALPSLQRAAQLAPDSADAHCDLGACLLALNRAAEAATTYETALRINPGLVAAHYNLGIASRSTNRAERAIASFSAAIALRPDLAEGHYGLGHALRDSDRIAEARACFERALSLNPDFAEARWSLAMSCLPSVPADSADMAAHRSAFAGELSRLASWFSGMRAASGHRAVGVQQPFALAYQEADNLELLRQHGALCAQLMEHSPYRRLTAAEASRPVAHPLRVGIVSEHFREHSVWNAIVRGWIGQIDREQFALYGFHLGVEQDAATDFARSGTARLECGPKDLGQWIDAILDCRPDVLIYPDVGMDPMTLKLASLRLAPVQATSWGHPETTGLPTIDYYLSAQDLEPVDAQAHYSEQLVTLPRLGVYLEPAAVEAVVPDLAQWRLDAAAPLFICPGTPFKYAPTRDRVFPEIARRLGSCRFVFFEHWTQGLSDRLRQRLARAFAAAGLDAERHLTFVPWQTRGGFHGLMRRADAFLDTIGFSGFNTALQAVDCGLPVVTCEGRFMRGRLASGILRRSGLDELVAPQVDDYVALAVRLAEDRTFNQTVRRRMQQAPAALYRDKLPIRALEDFLRHVARGRPG